MAGARNVMRKQTEFGPYRVELGCSYVDDLWALIKRSCIPREHTYACTGMHAILCSI